MNMDTRNVSWVVGLVLVLVVGIVGVAWIHSKRRRDLRAAKAATDYAAKESSLLTMLDEGKIYRVVREQLLDLTTVLSAFNADPSLEECNNDLIVIVCNTVWDVLARCVDVDDDRLPSAVRDDTVRTKRICAQLEQGRIDRIAQEILDTQLQILLLAGLAADEDDVIEKNKIALDALKITSIMLNSALRRARGEQI
jgi:hypothetical protein